MKTALFTLFFLFGNCCHAQYASLVYHFPKDSTTSKASYSNIFNVYNRFEKDILRYASNYFGSRNIPFIVDTTNKRVIGTTKFEFKGFKSACFHHGVITPEVRIYYRDGRSKIEFTNITYSGQGRCDSTGTIEKLFECQECKDFTDFNTWLYNSMVRESEKYHDFLKQSVRNKNDW